MLPDGSNNDAGAAAGAAGATAAAGQSGTAGATSTGVQPDYKALAEEWQKRAAGWQGSHDALKKRFDDEAAARATLAGDFKTLSEAKAALEAQIATLTTERDQTAAEAAQAKQKAERLEMVMVDFPQLAPFLKGNLLPTGTGDELRENLKRFADTLQGVASGNAQAALEQKQKEAKDASNGGTPPPPNGNTPNAADFLRQAREAMLAGNQAEYDRLYGLALKTQS